jgi:cell division septation protein DedD
VFVVGESHSEEIKACVRKNGQLRIVNDHSECAVNEEAKSFDTSINYDMSPKGVNATMPSSKKYMLTINKNGAGRGSVIVSPADTESDSDLSGRYTKGTLVVLTAMPDANSVFAGWKGDGCLGEGVCVLTMSSDKTVTATFHETNVSETFILPKGEKSCPPVLNKEEATRYEIEEAEKQTNGKALQFQKRSESIYTVQVGAFRNDSYAKSLKMILIQRGYDAYMTNSKSKNKGEFHKVLIGKFGDKGEAEKLSRKIAKTEGLQTFITLYRIGQ